MDKVGFTGTRWGMTPHQSSSFLELVKTLNIVEFHHGDCVGADADAHHIIQSNTEAKIVIHPPNNESGRAFCEAECILPKKEYLVRNHDIVNSSDILIATPGECTEQLRSGTWATIRYARKAGKKVYIIVPDGKII